MANKRREGQKYEKPEEGKGAAVSRGEQSAAIDLDEVEIEPLSPQVFNLVLRRRPEAHSLGPNCCSTAGCSNEEKIAAPARPVPAGGGE